MTRDPACCEPDSTVQQAAQLMVDCDCGEIPVIESEQTRRIVGVITDRDIACRVVAQGRDPRGTKVREVMSSPVVTVTPETTVEECCRIMEQNQVRRVPVIDQSNRCCGIISQADIAQTADEHETAEVVKDVSRRTESASMVGTA
ncbi:MAG TPA: CBS domain-containing protein [Phycisphaerae bacterium]|nr:CBS domain-containing protein [Phycisphaerae bacterium]HOJ73062.1 CBS domain-containing protein [Phycisphaerae bacterium]HOM52678.1 CBS domain-containing protein [Phycisphaerae bacterium]HON67371.1 CBS domain-containing protein [Phycisphaerae bacterium]HOQ85067.1 CBS domain-containing protein [Phycisphaerae bacterium]